MRQVSAALIVRPADRKILICQRKEDQPLPLKWEFPGGKIEPGEEPGAALKRELNEELGIEAEIGPFVTRIQHMYKNGRGVELHFFRVDRYTGEMENRIFKDLRWVDRRSLPQFDFLEADVKLVREIAAGKHI
ncbi:MAG: (deoxy)nucleoside triphosphate pyrophosphohydrolase [Acidobacteriales bacterium]|nr:(deoxy)nucleoside triphosphate pyrophosphohydrolase [Terriglobales bacterium]